MEVLNKIMPLILTAIMSMNLSGCGNSTGANGSPPAETSATSAQSVDEERPFELTNSIIIDGHEYSLPTDLESLSESVIVNKDAKAVSRIWYKNKNNEIGSCILVEGKILTIDINSCEDLPLIQMSGIDISKNMTFDRFIPLVENNSTGTVKMGIGDLGYGKIVRLQDDNTIFVVLFDINDRFRSARLQMIEENLNS